MSTLDRDAARNVLAQELGSVLMPAEIGDGLLDALKGCVRPAPRQTVDRDALEELLLDLRWQLTRYADPADRTAPVPESATKWADRILALLRPVGGVTLTREEARRAAVLLHDYDEHFHTNITARSLAIRLEAAP